MDFADFAVGGLPTAADGNGFAVCLQRFAECLWHTAKEHSPVV
jgi:hypothetical protein